MTTRTATNTLLFICALTIGANASAHEGPHKVMGTVSVVRAHSLEVKATTGKSVTINVDDKTRVVHGRMAMKVADIKAGDRVVVTAVEKKGVDGKATLRASEIRLGAPAAKTRKQLPPGR